MFAGLVLLVSLLDIGAGPEIITGPLLLDRVGARRDGLAAGQRDRLRGARRAERRGRGPAEHRDPARRVDRHRARRRDPHLRADRRRSSPASRTTRRSPTTSPSTRRPSWRPACRSCPTRTCRRRSTTRTSRPETADAVVDENDAGPDRGSALSPRACWRSSASSPCSSPAASQPSSPAPKPSRTRRRTRRRSPPDRHHAWPAALLRSRGGHQAGIAARGAKYGTPVVSSSEARIHVHGALQTTCARSPACGGCSCCSAS